MLGEGVALGEVALRGSGMDASARALAARMTVPPAPARLAAIDALVRALKGAGVWTKLDYLWLLAAHDAQAGRVNWIGAANDLSVGGSPAFTVDRGYAGDGSAAYLASGYLFPGGYQDNAHLMVWSRSGAAEANPIVIGNANSVLSLRRGSPADDASFVRVNGPTSFQAVDADASGCWVASRTGAGSGGMALYHNGAALTLSGGGASETPDATYPVWLLGRNGPVPAYSSRQLAAASLGKGLSAGEAGALRSAVGAYLATLGAA